MCRLKGLEGLNSVQASTSSAGTKRSLFDSDAFQYQSFLRPALVHSPEPLAPSTLRPASGQALPVLREMSPTSRLRGLQGYCSPRSPCSTANHLPAQNLVPSPSELVPQEDINDGFCFSDRNLRKAKNHFESTS